MGAFNHEIAPRSSQIITCSLHGPIVTITPEKILTDSMEVTSPRNPQRDQLQAADSAIKETERNQVDYGAFSPGRCEVTKRQSPPQEKGVKETTDLPLVG